MEFRLRLKSKFSHFPEVCRNDHLSRPPTTMISNCNQAGFMKQERLPASGTFSFLLKNEGWQFGFFLSCSLSCNKIVYKMIYNKDTLFPESLSSPRQLSASSGVPPVASNSNSSHKLYRYLRLKLYFGSFDLNNNDLFCFQGPTLQVLLQVQRSHHWQLLQSSPTIRVRAIQLH